MQIINEVSVEPQYVPTPHTSWSYLTAFLTCREWNSIPSPLHLSHYAPSIKGGVLDMFW